MVRVARNSLIVAVLLSLPAVAPAFGQQDETLSITVRQGQNIRDISAEYLGDPDLWTEILRFNGLSSVTEVHPGLELKIPAGRVSEANRALAQALEVIQAATREGAKLFAPEPIAKAIALRDAALGSRKAGDWNGCVRLARQAQALAEQALQVSLAQRDAKAEAMLTDRHGSVEGRKPADLLWNERMLNTVLIEQEKVRTLSRSTAQITFRDDSRLRLNPHSQAIIQRMRVDPLSNNAEAKVTLLEGDLYALLAGKSDHKVFDLEVPGVETEIDSISFWAARDPAAAKFSNFDDGKLAVTAAGGTVTLAKNQGTIVSHGEQPSPSADLLPRPHLATPGDDEISFRTAVELSWASVADAAGYWLEIADDQAFREMVLSQWAITDSRFVTEPLEPGSYYWRIAALDRFGLPGARSDVRRFNVRTDAEPPYLAVHAPEEGAIIRDLPIVVSGESEPGASLTLNGRPLDVGNSGGFDSRYQLRTGPNQLTFLAQDPAGNKTRRILSVVYMPDQASPIAYDPSLPKTAPKAFLTQGKVFSLAGRTDANARVDVRSLSGTGHATGYSDGDGRFVLNVPVERPPTEEFGLSITGPSGFVTPDQFTVAVDGEPPLIELDEWLPPVTAAARMEVQGRAIGAASLLVNGKPVTLAGDDFVEAVELKPGRNPIELVATDLVGNVQIERWDVVLDQDPPELLAHSIAREKEPGGERLTIEVKAKDASGMKQVAPFTVKIGEFAHSDYLKLNQVGQSYGTTMLLPGDTRGTVILLSIELEDYVGNRRRYEIR